MKVELEDLSPVKKRLAVEAEGDEVARETEAVVRRFAAQVRIPGFRAGKAPIDLVRRRFAKEIEEDVRERLVVRMFRDAVAEKGIKPLGDPTLEDLSRTETGLSFKTTVEVLPTFRVDRYRGVEVRETKVAVGDTDLDQALDSLREAHVRYVAEEGRAAVHGDLLVADLEETVEGGEPRLRERAPIELGHPDHLPAFTEAILAVKPSETREFHVAYPSDYPGETLRGKTVRYRIVVHEVKRREVPSLDDDFARDMGDFENLDALRARIGQDLLARKEADARRGLRQSILDKVLLENPIPLPEILVEEEIRSRLEDMVRSMVFHRIDPRTADMDWKALRDRQEEPARKSVHARLVLDAVAEAEGLAVDRAEVEARIRAEAARIGESEEALRGRLQKGGGLEALTEQLLREKSLDFMTSVANIQRPE
jgi:trigger factor